MLMQLVILAIFVCLISVIVWITMTLAKNDSLKKISLISVLALLVCGVSTACTHDNGGNKNNNEKTEKVSKNKSNNIKVYPVTVTSTKVNSDGDLVVKGTSKAPEGAKILAESNIEWSNDTNEASPTNLDNSGYEKIKNGKFNITLDVAELFDSDELKVGQKLKPTIFAVTGYRVKYDDYKITANLRKAVEKAGLQPFVYKATASMCEKINNDVSEDTEDTDDDSDNEDSSSNTGNLTKSEKVTAALAILKKSYNGKAEVKYDSSTDMFTILPTVDGYRDVIDEAQDGDTSNWETITDSIDKVSESLYENVKLKIPVSLLNPDNTSRVLYTSIDGLGSYDFTEDN